MLLGFWLYAILKPQFTNKTSMIHRHLSLALLVVFGLTVTGAACSKKNLTTNTTTTNTSTTNTAVSTDPAGTIVVDAQAGTLGGAEASTTDFIAELARGWVAYLGSKGATATYTVEAAADGTYTLWAKVDDDGTWNNGFRDANITVNGTHVLTYHHISQNTNGWKWISIGNCSLKAGANTVTFAKANDMPAAYSMNAFKLVPVAS